LIHRLRKQYALLVLSGLTVSSQEES
jgi:hypothetical protein